MTDPLRVGFTLMSSKKPIGRTSLLRFLSIPKPESQDLLMNFLSYCHDHPRERFWQALRNWSGAYAIRYSSQKVGLADVDTYYWEGRKGFNADI